MIIEIEDRYIEELKYKIQELQSKNAELPEKLHKAEQDKEYLSFRIRNELEPSIKAEERAYDLYVSIDHVAEAADSFCCKVDELVDMVRENDNYFVWADSDGDLYEKILSLIKNKDNCSDDSFADGSVQLKLEI